tara:strand:+ start:1324 stop:2334 length:1011 start_codon:yes stop_codon:yes gene_type:complete
MLFNIIDNIKVSYRYNYMKFLESHFIEYIQSYEKISLHPSMKKIYASFPDKIEQLKNIMFYGPSGVGKYTQMLCAIKKYSATGLKYEKKLNCVHNKNNYYFKISDIHFEVDMGLLGCNAKLLWSEIYNNMVDVLSSRTNKSGIIVCKNFHKIHGELLDCFYSYIQGNNTSVYDIKFILLTESISFIPDNIVNTFYILSIPRPTKTLYAKLNGKQLVNIKPNQITNIKNLFTKNDCIQGNVDNFIDGVYNLIKSPNAIKFITFRDVLYDIFIYDIDIGIFIWGIFTRITNDKVLNQDQISELCIDIFTFLQYFNNNYRPIYHIEKFVYNIINKIHGF